MALPAGHRKAAGWDDFFKDLGLVPTDRPAPKSPKGYTTPGACFFPANRMQEVLGLPFISKSPFMMFSGKDVPSRSGFA